MPNLPGDPLGRGTLKITTPAGAFEVPADIGSFDWLVPVGSPGPLAPLGLEFSAQGPLPGRDARPVGGKLEWLEVFPSLPTYTFEFGKPTSTRLAATGIDQDGWFARSATLQLPPFAGPHDLVLTFEYPGWSDKPQGIVTASSSALAQPARATLTPGAPVHLRLRLAGATGPRTLRLDADSDFPLTAPDPRRRSGRLVQAELQPVTGR